MTFRFLTVLAVFLPWAVQADEPVSHDQYALLDPVVVTPTLTSLTTQASLSSVTVIDRQQLREQQPAELTDILQGQPGVDVSGNGAFGKTTGLYLRGTASNSTQLLLDGVRLRSATAGSPSWQYLPPQLIDRVEVVRGPRGSLYGADAVGGVIQVFTPEQPGSWLDFGGGSFGSVNTGAGTAGEQGGTFYSVGINRFSTQGTQVRAHSEDRGYDNTAGIARLGHRFDDRGSVSVMGFHSQGNTEYEGSNPEDKRDTDYALEVAALNGDLWLNDNWQSKLVISQAKDESQDFADGDKNGTFDTRTRTANWQNIVLAGDQQFIVGGEYQRDEITSDNDYDVTDRDNRAAFMQALLTAGPADLQASLRYDDNDAYGEKTTGAAALGYQFLDHYRARLSYGTAFKAPTFNDLYYPDSPPYYYSNPNLKPESSASTEAGLRGQYQYWYWDLALYQTRIDDMITYDASAATSLNVDKARIKGGELAMGLEWQDWRLRAAFSALDPRDDATDNVLIRRAQRTGRLDVDRHLGRLTLGGTASFQGHRYNDAANQQRLPGYGLVDLRARWQLTRQWYTQLTVKNVLDKRYSTSKNFAGWNYLNAGRSVFMSVRYDVR
ncbi:TonB-dependent receptor protein [Alcanivorax hongdengensis A-11-3]|uniref:TonB-dependent receptor protein n=1 Tax=Alcanivorax hongdengensis A-11-3 TaxID=1177179 RepID=L0WI49_9GAMM|nr:TonB-dependent receptor [Alcanivorax hongdengensis]EKF75510.1 TonB-dependent receptor protein [Alcanivorax hongdengensis A-11-3]